MALMVDTSVWIDFFRGNDTPEVRRLEEYLQGDEHIFTGDLILTELLQGIRPGWELATFETAFQAFLVVNMVGEHNARQSASFYRHLLSQGITVRKTIACLIATWCILNQVPLLHADQDFQPFVTLGLIEG